MPATTSERPVRGGVATAPRLVGIALLAAGTWAAAEDPWQPGSAPANPAAGSGPAPASPTGSGDAYRPLGPNLFPLYQNYLRTADSTEVTNVLYLYTHERNRDTGGSSTLLFPLFHHSRDEAPPRGSLSIFPLLWFQGWGPDGSHAYSVPFYWQEAAADSWFQLLVPFWLRNERGGAASTHILPPLFRQRVDRDAPEAPVSSTRLGLWRVLELFERRRDASSIGLTALNLFNWGEPTRGGLPFFGYASRRRGDVVEGSAHLFPLFWSSREEGLAFHALFPFYAYSTNGLDEDVWLPALLSRVGWGPEESRRVDALFPLFHYRGDRASWGVWSFPFIHWSVDEPENRWMSVAIPYHTSIQTKTGKRTHSILYPLSRFDNEPDGSRGDNWFFPYIETHDDKSLWRFFLPVYYENQTLAAGRTDWFFRLGVPTHLSTGTPESWFSTFFPLWWGSRDGPRGWQMLLPVYYDFWSVSSRSTHVIPFVSVRSAPSRHLVSVVGPLYVHERFYGRQREPIGGASHLLWPLVTLESRDDGYRYSLLPLFQTSRRGESSDLLLSPFYYRMDGPRGRKRYFLPAYGRYESDVLTRDMYALATYARTKGYGDDGSLVSDRHDVLWSLISRQQEYPTGLAHTRVLPLGFWRTTTPTWDLTVAGPFYYGDREVRGDETDRLDLVLGNLYLSSVRDRRGPEPAPVVPADPTGGAAEAAKTPGDALYPLGAAGATTATTRVWSDRGVLWPITRWYRSENGDAGHWLIPFYFNVRSEMTRTTAVFPLFYRQSDIGPYNLSFFRYFFLGNHETWRGGYRWSAAQALVDWKADESSASYRLRILYPMLEHSWDPEGYAFKFTPMCLFSRRGETVENRFFPIYWQGRTVRDQDQGDRRPVDSHFFLFPLFGNVVRSTHRDVYAPFPLFHVRTSIDALRFELWPLLFYRDEPALAAVRLWPLHADESRVNAGDFWVSRWLFFSKRFELADGFAYRLDPFLFRVSSGEDSFGIATLLELLAYDRDAKGASFRFLPFALGHSDESSSSLGVFPLYYGRANRDRNTSYGDPWRFFFAVNRLSGSDGERHTSVLWKLFEHTDSTARPEYDELGLLYRLFHRRVTETSTSFAVNPFYSHYRNEADDETQHSFLFSIYRYRRFGDYVQNTLFWVISF